MKAAIYNPYLDTMGGGERYTLTIAQLLIDLGYDVDVEWLDKTLMKKLEERFGLNLKKVNFVWDVKKGDGYDVCFWVSDGSIPTLRARKNILHFQVPFIDVGGGSLLNRMKLFRINSVVVNSYFTKEFIDKEYGVSSKVIYPPVDTTQIKPKRKENIILSVGRFSNLLQNKNQDILVTSFKKMFDEGLKDWVLILAGGIEVGAEKFIIDLKKSSQGYPIQILESPNFNILKKIYGKAKVFWSASGYGVDEILEPEKTEHFGISVVEAMASGCVPMVFAAGGHKEIIEDCINGYFWHNPQELIEKTIEIIKDDKTLRLVTLNAKTSALKYSIERFRNEFELIVK